MNIIYNASEIIDVEIGDPIFNSKFTKFERLTIYGCPQPNPTVWSLTHSYEQGNESMINVVAAIVTAGLITQQRADEILN